MGSSLVMTAYIQNWEYHTLNDKEAVHGETEKNIDFTYEGLGDTLGGFTVKTCMIAREFIKRGLNQSLRYRMYIYKGINKYFENIFT